MRHLTSTTVALALALGSVRAAPGSAIYWADQNGAVLRANLDGSGQQALFTQGRPGTTGIALDIVSNQMYFTNQGSSGNVTRARLDGTSLETLVAGGVSPFG